jgi:transposase
MSPKFSLRKLTSKERRAIQIFASSRTTEARLVERARIITLAAQGLNPSQIARELGISRPTVYTWIRRFNLQGVEGLEDQPRSGRPATYPPEQVAAVLAAAMTDPQTLGLPFGSWTLDRLQAYLNEKKKIPIKRSRIDEILLAEGLRWRKQESWFGERVDPEFAEKRGRSSDSTPARRSLAWSSASTRWDRRLPRAHRAKKSSAQHREPTPMGRRAPLDGRSRRSRPAHAVAAVTSTAPSVRRPARRSRAHTSTVAASTGSTSSSMSTCGFRQR